MSQSMGQADACFTDQPMLSADQARERLVASAAPPADTERVHLREALGRVLAHDVVSPMDVPGFDNSAMDGYALNSADTSEQGAWLPVSQRIPAGHPGGELVQGSAARIFTGAPLPLGADAVVMQEECRVEEGRVHIPRAIPVAANVRPRANDIARGAVVLKAGQRLSPQAIGLLASLGVAKVKVYRRVRVALFNTGDEIIEPGQPLAAGQIYNSNRYSLAATLQQVGCEVVDLGQIEDTLEATRAGLREAAQGADLVLTSGGVSVGEEDHVRVALQAEGELSLWKVRMKPGKPLAFGRVGDVPFIGLPGNPVSAFVTLCLFGMPFIRVMQGRSRPFPEPAPARCNRAFDKPLKRREYLRVQLNFAADGVADAVLFQRQGSDVFTSTLWASGVLEVPEDTRLPAGSLLNYWSFESLLS